MKDKIERFLEVADCVERLSDEELRGILDDNEMGEICRVVSKAADAMTPSSEVDVEEEWQRFRQMHPEMRSIGIFPRIMRFASRNAAAVIICCAASVAAVAVAVGLDKSFGRRPVSGTEVTEISRAPLTVGVLPAGIAMNPQPDADIAESVVFKNQPLDSVLSAIADYYGAEVEFKNAGSKQLRLYFQWERRLSLDEVLGQLDIFGQLDIRLENNKITVE